MMQELLIEIWQEFKTTVIFVTHDIEQTVLLGDRILIMVVNSGYIKEDIAIDLTRPRHIDRTLTPEFMQISRQILATIREETLKSIVSS